MNYEFHQSPFSKAMLTGLFVGIIATVVCLIYNIIYRDSTGFYPADFINVSSLIFAINLLFWVLGIVYFIFLRTFKKADIIFIAVFALLTLFCLWRSIESHRSDNPQITTQF